MIYYSVIYSRTRFNNKKVWYTPGQGLIIKKCDLLQDKDARLEELRLLMRSLKLALLVPNNILTVQVIAEKLEVQPDLVSG